MILKSNLKENQITSKIKNFGGKMLDNYFEYKKHKTDFRTEVVAGITTFLTCLYNVS